MPNYVVKAYEQGWIQYEYLVLNALSPEDAVNRLSEWEHQDSRPTGDVLPLDEETVIDLDEDNYTVEEVAFSEFEGR